MTVVSMNYLLEAGVHFGHQKRRWNPKMGEYIYTSRDDIYIIDLQKTAKKIEEAYMAMKEVAANDGKILFVGTKKQAQEASEECALRSGMYFVNERWLGGTLTNFKTIRARIKRLDEIEKMESEGTFELLPKKEVINIKKEYEKLNRNLRGIREMRKLPDAIIIVDPRKEDIAIKEARILKIPIFGVVDTNCDPDMVDYVVPGNDDAVRSVKLMIGVLTNAICEVTGKEVVDYLTDEDKNRAGKSEKIDRKPRREVEAIKEEVTNKEAVTVKKEVEAVKEEVANKEAVTVKKEVEAIKEEVEAIKEEVANKEAVTVKKEVEAVKEEIAKEEIKEEPKKKTKPEVKKEAVELVEEKVEVVANSNMNLTELKEMAKTKGIKGYSKMKKDELLEALK